MRFRLVAAGLAAVLLLVSAAAVAQINPFGRTGFELTSGDAEALGAASRKILDNPDAPIGQKESWSNAQSGAQGTVQYEKSFSYKDLPCRRLQHDIIVPRASNDYRFIIDYCRIESGEWKIL